MSNEQTDDILIAIGELQSALCWLNESDCWCLIHLITHTRWRRLEGGPICLENGGMVQYNLKNSIDDTNWQVPTRIRQLPMCQESAMQSDFELNLLLHTLAGLKSFFPVD